MTQETITVLIVGGGIGGLAAALGFAKSGHSVVVLEQASAFGEVGAGIQIPPNSSRILNEWGLKDKLEKHAMIPGTMYFRSYKSGGILSHQPLNPYTTETYGYPYYHIHRADFHTALVETVSEEQNSEIILGERVEHIDTEKNEVVTAKGHRYRADLVIGADGLKSKIRTLFKGAQAYNTGQMAYRMLIRSSKLRDHPELKHLCERPNLNYWLGPNMHCVVYLLQSGEQCNVVIICPDTLPEDAMVQDVSVQEMRDLFQDWDPTFQTLISLVESTSKWRLQNSKELDSWVHPSANLALLGDACHATLPCLAQGAAQAVEDAGVLCELFANLQSKRNIHQILEVYEELRKKRTTTIIDQSTDLGENVFHLPDGPLQEERDRLMAIDPPQVGCPNKWADPQFQQFLFGYNAFEEAGKSLTSAATESRI